MLSCRTPGCAGCYLGLVSGYSGGTGHTLVAHAVVSPFAAFCMGPANLKANRRAAALEAAEATATHRGQARTVVCVSVRTMCSWLSLLCMELSTLRHGLMLRAALVDMPLSHTCIQPGWWLSRGVSSAVLLAHRGAGSSWHVAQPAHLDSHRLAPPRPKEHVAEGPCSGTPDLTQRHAALRIARGRHSPVSLSLCPHV